MIIEPPIPFGLKVFVHQHNKPEPLPFSKPLLYVRYEEYSNSMRCFDPTSTKVVVRRYFSITQLMFKYRSKKVLKKDSTNLLMSKVIPLHYKSLESIVTEPLFTSTTMALNKPKPNATVSTSSSHPAMVEQALNCSTSTNPTIQKRMKKDTLMHLTTPQPLETLRAK
ncbi:hypothetical protein O181_001159 [Austropuccinia psidii MF-1]|uniref:Uncharacterized protein n=1 Tax=Austropuccinia psidii MF-1 TaxID=1389203 RepID=A0A9Q3B9Z2_9BASI|nr:hypothetical protein [Austropuccinia psidii MF-1]